MASIYLDKQSQTWKIKTKVNGKDKRVSVRKSKPGESNKPIPDDVLHEAHRLGFSDLGSKSGSKSAPTAQDLVSKSTTNLVQFIEEFQAHYTKTSRSGSAKKMNGILRNFRKWLTTKPDLTDLHEITKMHIQEFFNWRVAQIDPRLKIKVKPHCIVGDIELLSGMFRWACEVRELIPGNPVKVPLAQLHKLHPKPKPEDQTKYLDPDQLKEFLKALDQGVKDGVIPLDYADLAILMLVTGMRVQATVDLDYSWINKDWEVKIPSESDKCKTGYSTVVAELGKAVILRRRGLQMSGRVFPQNITPDMSYHFIRKLIWHYKLDDLGSYNHMLRHTFGTACVDAGIPLQVTMELMGQRDIKTTMRYAKVRSAVKREAVAKLKFGS